MCCNYKINNELLQEKGAKEKATRKTKKKSARVRVNMWITAQTYKNMKIVLLRRDQCLVFLAVD